MCHTSSLHVSVTDTRLFWCYNLGNLLPYSSEPSDWAQHQVTKPKNTYKQHWTDTTGYTYAAITIKETMNLKGSCRRGHPRGVRTQKPKHLTLKEHTMKRCLCIQRWGVWSSMYSFQISFRREILFWTKLQLCSLQNRVLWLELSWFAQNTSLTTKGC